MSDDMEGKTPLTDHSGLLITACTQTELNAAEFDNVSRATKKYLGAVPSKLRAPFTFSWFLQLHREMFGKVWTWAGQLRKTNKNIGLEKQQIPEALRLLEHDYHAWFDAELGTRQLIAQLHHRAVWIHPFENGNGRWTRMLVNIHLKQQGQPLIHWPDKEMIRKTDVRQQYLQALRAADHGHFDALMKLHETYQ